jgi:hypothetical protein
VFYDGLSRYVHCANICAVLLLQTTVLIFTVIVTALLNTSVYNRVITFI